MADIKNNIADAEDALPAAGATSDNSATNSEWIAFTTETDDPTEIGSWTTPGYTGWIKVVGPTGGTSIRLHATWTGSHYPVFLVYDGVPNSSSTSFLQRPYWENEDPHPPIPLAEGQTFYICMLPGDGAFWDEDGIASLEVSRSPDISGYDIQDNIADAQDFLPAESSWSYATAADMSWFTPEANEPDYLHDWWGDPAWPSYTGWIKLEVPSGGATVDIDTIGSEIFDTILFLFDEEPTTTSVPIAENDDGPFGGSDYRKSLIQEQALAEGTYWVLVVPYDGHEWDYVNDDGTGAQIRVYRYGGTTYIDSATINAIVLRTWAPPVDLSVPTVIATSTGAVDNNAILSLSAPSGAQAGDLMLASISWDKQATSGLGLSSPSSNWTVLTHQSLSNNDQAISHYWTRYDPSDPGPYDFRTSTVFNPSVATAKAGGIVLIRGAAPITTPVEHMFTYLDTTYTIGYRSGAYYNPLQSDPLYGVNHLWFTVWAGAAAGYRTWGLYSDATQYQTEAYQISASNYANLVSAYFTTPWAYIPPRLAAPSASEVTMISQIRIRGPQPILGIEALIGTRRTFSIEAVINAVTLNQHYRSGPHVGTQPDTAIVTSALLGGLPAGTDLHDVVADLEARISNLERKEM